MKGWHPEYVLALFRRSRETPAVQAMVRFLAHDPWFCRSVCPDAMVVNEAFVFPLVLRALVTLRGTLRWPPPPMNDDGIERTSGVPQLGRALDAAGVCKRDKDGLYDLAPMDEIMPWHGPKKKRSRVNEKLKRLGMRTVDGGPAQPLMHWTPKE